MMAIGLWGIRIIFQIRGLAKVDSMQKSIDEEAG